MFFAWYDDQETALVRGGLLPLLVLLVFVSAIGVVYLKHREVQLYITLQGIQKRYAQSLEEQGRLRLEEAAWGNLARTEDHAREQLKMGYPQSDQRVLVR